MLAFTTKDGSEIRELLSHRNSSIRHQSLADVPSKSVPEGALQAIRGVDRMMTHAA